MSLTNRRYRKGSVLAHLHGPKPIDRNLRARIMHHARCLEGRTRPRGLRKQGQLGTSALMVLNYLLFHRLNPETGRCDPSLADIAKGTGLHRDTVIEAMKRLEAAGYQQRTRRRIRMHLGRWERDFQWTNAYSFSLPASESDIPAGTTVPSGQVKKESVGAVDNGGIVDNRRGGQVALPDLLTARIAAFAAGKVPWRR